MEGVDADRMPDVSAVECRVSVDVDVVNGRMEGVADSGAGEQSVAGAFLSGGENIVKSAGFGRRFPEGEGPPPSLR